MVKRSNNVEGCGQTVKRPFSPTVNGQDNVNEPFAHAHYAWVKGQGQISMHNTMVNELFWTVKNLDPGRSYMYSAYIVGVNYIM